MAYKPGMTGYDYWPNPDEISPGVPNPKRHVGPGVPIGTGSTGVPTQLNYSGMLGPNAAPGTSDMLLNGEWWKQPEDAAQNQNKTSTTKAPAYEMDKFGGMWGSGTNPAGGTSEQSLLDKWSNAFLKPSYSELGPYGVPTGYGVPGIGSIAEQSKYGYAGGGSGAVPGAGGAGVAGGADAPTISGQAP